MAELLPGPEAQASIYAFDVVERRIKRGVGIPEAEPRRIRRVGVVGAGLMATQLATLFLRRLEVPVVLTDVDPARVERRSSRSAASRRGWSPRDASARAKAASWPARSPWAAGPRPTPAATS